MAASALGALAYFGTDFYADLKDNGAVQVSTPDDVTTGVAQGIYDAGMTIASSAYAAEKSGSPIAVSWPKPGAVAIYGPIALAKSSHERRRRPGVHQLRDQPGGPDRRSAEPVPTRPSTGSRARPSRRTPRSVHPDWTALGRQKATLLEDYAKIFGASR